MSLKTIGLISFLAFTSHSAAHAQEPKQKESFAIAANLLHITEDNVGFGFSYEHFLNSSKNISLYLPFSYALPVSNYSHYSGPMEETIDLMAPSYQRYYPNLHYEWTEARGMAYFYPGIKVYTGKSLRRVSYCIGASLLAGLGSAQRNAIDYVADTITITSQYVTLNRREVSNVSETISRFKMGMMLTNALNIRVNNHIYTGIEVGLGYTYVNREGGINMQRGMLAQMALKLGYHK